jgi:small subunit ribosomal protein S21
MSDSTKGLAVRCRPNEDPEKFIKRFLRKVRNDGILQEVYEKSRYEKPSVKRRRKSARARFLKKIEDRELL